MSIWTRKTKIAVLLFVALSAVGSAGILSVWPGAAYAAPAAPLPVGIVDYMLLINQHPDTPQANEILRVEQEQAKKEYDLKAVNLSAPEKQELDRQLGQRVEVKRQELLKMIADKVNAAVKEVADGKGLLLILPKGNVIYGGVDITQDVLAKITGK